MPILKPVEYCLSQSIFTTKEIKERKRFITVRADENFYLNNKFNTLQKQNKMVRT